MCKKLWEETIGSSQLGCKTTKANIMLQILRLVSVNVHQPLRHQPTSWKLTDLYEFCSGDFKADAHQHTHTHTAHTFLLTTSSSLHCSSPSFLHLLLHFVCWSFFSTLDFLPHFPHHIFSCSPINSLFLDCNFSHPASPSRFLRVDCLVIAAAYFSATLPPYLFFLFHSGWSGFDNVRAMEVWRFKGTVSV